MQVLHEQRPSLTVMCCRFEDFVAVTGNRCIEWGRYLERIKWQTQRRIFQEPGYTKRYLAFINIACSKRHALRIPSEVRNGQFKFGGDF